MSAFRILAATGLLFLFATAEAKAAYTCEITSCRKGGSIRSCWGKMRKEFLAKKGICPRLKIVSGNSAYAMATSLPNVCIASGASIGIHRPFFKPTRVAVAIGSDHHMFYFGRIKPRALAYFTRNGGMRRSGASNAYGMIHVPARASGVPLCR